MYFDRIYKNNDDFYLYKVEFYINMTNIEGVFFQIRETDKEIAKPPYTQKN